MIAHFTSVGGRIIGDFSNATLTNRLAFQTSTLNAAAQVPILPNGLGGAAGVIPFNNSDPTNAAYFLLGARATDATLTSGITGTGTYLPMTFYTGGALRMTLDISGNLTLATGTISVSDVTITSDERLKTNWRKFDSDVLQRLSECKRGIYDRTDVALTQVGTSANDFQKVLPQGVMENDRGFLQISQSATLALLAELTALVLAQGQRIAELEQRA
jgi:hypothetical protein